MSGATLAGPGLILESMTWLCIAVLIKSVSFALLERRLSTTRAATLMLAANVLSTIPGVEESFDIRIEDTEAEKVLTPRQLIDLVMSKVETTTTDVCLTHRSFNLLRGFFVRCSHLQRGQIKPTPASMQRYPASSASNSSNSSLPTW